jgi:hypothetical protein
MFLLSLLKDYPRGLRPDPADWENPIGPYKVVMEVDKTLPHHTIYRPVNLIFVMILKAKYQQDLFL